MSSRRPTNCTKRYPVDGSQFRSGPWRCGDRRHHLLHQYLQSVRHDRRRPSRPQCGEEGSHRQALGQDVARPRQPGGDRISEILRPAEGSRQARLRSRRLWLHHLHRQFRPACPRRSRKPIRRTISSPPPCSPATAISKAASIPMCAPIISPRRRSSSPMRWRARSMSTWQGSARHGQGRQARLSARTSGRAQGDRRDRAQERHPPGLRHRYKDRVQGRCRVAQDQGRGRPHLQMEHVLHLCAEPALFRRHEDDARAGDRHRQRPHPRPLPQLDHHRSHLARRQHQARRARPAPISPSIRCRRSTSTPMARGAAITKS